MFSKNLFPILSLLLLASCFVQGAVILSKNNQKKHKIHISENAIDLDKYQVEYQLDLEEKIITFDVTVETTGYIGFGLSPAKGMTGADIVIGGVRNNGESYFSDRHATGTIQPIEDNIQNWDLLEARENGTHTYLKFSRLFDTCDEEDVPITEDTLSIIWSYGATDDIVYHGPTERGSKDVNLLDPKPDIDVSKFDVWLVNQTMAMPKRATSYWCSIHKAPRFTEKRHVVGFNTLLETDDAMRHTHHFDMYQCISPPGQDIDEIFGHLVGHEGAECNENNDIIPVQYCYSRVLNAWATGGGPMLLPEHAGYTLQENDESVYVMLQIHYDNPTEREGVIFSTAVQVYHTTELREHEAAMLVIDHLVTYSLLIPPNTNNFVTVGHCSSGCTSRLLPPEGINIFNVLHHAHLAGRKIKLRQFRDGQEMPWISVDNNYAFDFQQNRNLREDRKLLQGDQVTIECTYDTTGRNVVTFGGLSTTHEMCQAIIWYYPRSDLSFCGSAYPQETFLNQFGIEEVNWDNIMWDPVILAPEDLVGRTFVDVLTNDTDWNPEKVAEMQNEIRFGNHYEASCSNGIGYNEFKGDLAKQGTKQEADITYPEIGEEYAPENTCIEPGTTTENPGENFVCPAPSGSFSDPQDCAGYYTCDNGAVVGHHFCPDGLYFNPEYHNCDFPWNVDCDIRK